MGHIESTGVGEWSNIIVFPGAVIQETVQTKVSGVVSNNWWDSRKINAESWKQVSTETARNNIFKSYKTSNI